MLTAEYLHELDQPSPAPAIVLPLNDPRSTIGAVGPIYVVTRTGHMEYLDGERESVPGRNDPCWCESGKKYKRCCGVS